MAREAPAPGTRIAGKYEVERVLGQGGMGVVVAARHLVTGNRVAIKFLLAEALKQTTVVARFINEARASLQIQSEHVARVIDVDSLPNGLPYIVMELLDGNDLAAEIAKRTTLEPAVAVGYVLQALEALAEAHVLGIVHRDLKPANLFLSRRRDGTPLVKVLDFGISKLTMPIDGGPLQNLTSTGGVLGSPTYMSPEQLTSAKGADARSDIWSIGVLLFEMLTGRPPFEDDTLGGLVVKIATRPVPDIHARTPGIPEGLARAISACLTKEPESRTPTVAALALALEPFAPASAKLSVERVSRIMDSARPPPPSAAGAVGSTIDVAVSRPEGGTGTAHLVPSRPPTQAAWAPSASMAHASAVVPLKRRRWIVPAAIGSFVLLGVLGLFVARPDMPAAGPSTASFAPAVVLPASAAVDLAPPPDGAAVLDTPMVAPVAEVPKPPASAASSGDPSSPTKSASKGRPPVKVDPPVVVPPAKRPAGPQDFGGK